ncbi:hypothetical protein BKK54_07255 [Rodentibacter genomosp. 1]|uniref:Mor transcription activator domain-containing protein n=1 Tax=Rodentibacter genomosp. 1 TaxID=1908264 RepID=A0A1V3J475_9PAST|nr:Mor transcription activator family protein [Rodentibacter genomosp. 1]OOF49984.1 hypothetical protein BKK54_07255 [Rodentibacter genomosp. 1]
MLSFKEFAYAFQSSVQEAEALGLKGEELSSKALKTFQFKCGGLNLYIPKWKSSHQTSDRDKAIIEEFNGINHTELAKKYGLSVQWIYSILRKSKKKQEKAQNETH